MEEKFNKLISERNIGKDKVKDISLFESETLNQHILSVNGVDVEFTSNQFFKNVKVMSEGSAFGENALFSKSKRTATIKSLD